MKREIRSDKIHLVRMLTITNGCPLCISLILVREFTALSFTSADLSLFRESLI